jgi:hypothetical protein
VIHQRLFFIFRVLSRDLKEVERSVDGLFQRLATIASLTGIPLNIRENQHVGCTPSRRPVKANQRGVDNFFMGRAKYKNLRRNWLREAFLS